MQKKISIQDIVNSKNKKKITMLTAYNKSTAEIIDKAGIDIVLVGDSYAMVELGYSNTYNIDVEEMLIITSAVSRGINKSLIVADMPFLSFQQSKRDAIINAGRFIRAGANAVKIENSGNVYRSIKGVVDADIPVMGHIGLTPQSYNRMGGYKIQGKDYDSAVSLIEAAKKLQDCGVFAIVIEGIPVQLAEIISNEIDIPTIGIGAGHACDGQVLVLNDILGFGNSPKHNKVYVNLPEIIQKAVTEYKSDVENEIFPGRDNSVYFDASLEKEIKEVYNK